MKKSAQLSVLGSLGVAASLLAGCSHVEQSPALTQTDIRLSQRPHFIAMPPTATVTHDDYDELWEACIGAARYRGYRVDRTDYRGGVIVTHPVANKQVFEVWKRDVGGFDFPDLTESTLATMRRVLRFEITRREDGTFECAPKVLVERYSSSERRITSIVQYRETFSIETAQGNKERDKGVNIPDTYWYTTARDASMERLLADAVESRVRGLVASR